MPEAFECAGPEVLDEHVGFGREIEQPLPVSVGLQVEHDAPLAPSEQLPCVGVATGGREPAHAAHTVTGGGFDLDDVGPEVGEVTRRARTREHRRHVDDPQTRECLHRPSTARAKQRSASEPSA